MIWSNLSPILGYLTSFALLSLLITRIHFDRGRFFVTRSSDHETRRNHGLKNYVVVISGSLFVMQKMSRYNCTLKNGLHTCVDEVMWGSSGDMNWANISANDPDPGSVKKKKLT